MAKEIIKNEEYTLGSGSLAITVYSGDGNHSDIAIKVDGTLKINGSDEIKDFDLKEVTALKGKEIYVYGRITKTGMGDHVSFTIKLKDDENEKTYSYSTVEADEDPIKYKVYITLN
jgi:hypothetical protein